MSKKAVLFAVLILPVIFVHNAVVHVSDVTNQTNSTDQGEESMDLNTNANVTTNSTEIQHVLYSAFFGDDCASGLVKLNGICIEID